MTWVDKVFPREIRKYLYGVSIAFVPVAIYFGWIEPEASVVIIPMIVAILNLNPKEPSVINEPYSEPKYGVIEDV